MSSFTLRNISSEMLDKIKELASRERRSINNQILSLLDEMLAKKSIEPEKTAISKSERDNIWDSLREDPWEDDKSVEEQIREVYNSRTVTNRDYDFD